MGDGNLIDSIGTGTVVITLRDGQSLQLQDVLYVPNLTCHLISVGKLTQGGYVCLFEAGGVHIIRRGRIEARGSKIDDVFELKDVVGVRTKAFAARLRPQHQKGDAELSASEYTELMHRRLGHLSESRMGELHTHAEGIRDKLQPRTLSRPCKICVRSKFVRIINRKPGFRATGKLDRVHCDTWGPYYIPTYDGFNYFFTITDEATRMSWVFLMSNKSDVYEVFRQWKVYVELQSGAKIKVARFDNAKEFKALGKTLTEEFGIHCEFTVPYYPEQNGIAERLNRTLVSIARSMLLDANLPQWMWGEAILAAFHTKNCLPTRGNSPTCSPHELWHGKKPNLAKFRAWGCLCYTHIPEEKRHKFDAVTAPRIFVGYESTLHQYRLFDPIEGSIERSINVEFFENETWGPIECVKPGQYPQEEAMGEDELVDVEFSVHITPNTITSNIDDYAVTSSAGEVFTARNGGNASKNVPENNDTFSQLAEIDELPSDATDAQLGGANQIDQSGVDQLVVEDVASHDDQTIVVDVSPGSPVSTPETTETTNFDAQEPDSEFESEETSIRRNPPRARHAPDRWEPSVKEKARFAEDQPEHLLQPPIPPIVEPKTYKRALHDKRYGREWKEAIEAELLALLARGTWDYVDIPEDTNLVDNKWVFKVKYTPDGRIDRFKARLVARGYSQLRGQDYDETFAPTMRKESFRIILAIAAYFGWQLDHMDVDNAFLESTILEEIFMSIPEGIKGQDGKCCRIRKGLYGLKQSARNWYLVLVSQFKRLGFRQTKDPGLFVNPKTRVVIGFHVDDLLIGGADREAVKATKNALSERFKMKDLGELTHFLGMRIRRGKTGAITLDQSQYTREILTRFGTLDATPISSPSENYNHMQRAVASDERCDQGLYQEAVGSLQYLAGLTRPDIQFEVNKYAQFLVDPSVSNWNGVRRVFRYLVGTVDYGITFQGPSQGPEDLDLGQLIGYSDSDFAASIEDRRCQFGYAFILSGGVVSWASIKQTSNVSSTTEAEYIAACEGGKEAVFLYEILYALWPKDHLPITLRGDNEGSIALAKNPEFHKRSKHIDNRYHYIRQLLADNLISIQHVPTKEMIADILTKPLKPTVFGPLLKKMGVGPV